MKNAGEDEKITLLLVDDHAIVRQGVRAFLEDEPDIQIVGEAASGEEAVKLCREYAPDVVLLDMLLLPGMNGAETARQIKQSSPRTHIVILTSYADDEYLLPAIRAGALSYLLKDVSPEEFLMAIRKARRGEAVLHPRIAAKLMRSLSEKGESEQPSPFAELSERELEVLRLIAEGLANAEIAEKLFISEKTVKSHVGNILSKLHLTHRTQAAILAWKTGVMQK